MGLNARSAINPSVPVGTLSARRPQVPPSQSTIWQPPSFQDDWSYYLTHAPHRRQDRHPPPPRRGRVCAVQPARLQRHRHPADCRCGRRAQGLVLQPLREQGSLCGRDHCRLRLQGRRLLGRHPAGRPTLTTRHHQAPVHPHGAPAGQARLSGLPGGQLRRRSGRGQRRLPPGLPASQASCAEVPR